MSKRFYSAMAATIMHWVKNEDGNFGILDGQQRTISLCTFVSIDDPARGYSIP